MTTKWLLPSNGNVRHTLGGLPWSQLRREALIKLLFPSRARCQF